MTWGEQNTQEEGFEQMDYAVEKEINFFDTAELYAIPPKEKTYGKTEEIIGNWFQKRKIEKKIILASKIAGPGLNGLGVVVHNIQRKALKKLLNESLKRLKTDYIDFTNYIGQKEIQIILES